MADRLKYHLKTVFRFDQKAGKALGQYEICKGRYDKEKVVWSRPVIDNEDIGEYSVPSDVRQKFEQMNGVPEFDPEWSAEKFINNELKTHVNIVEIMNPEESAFDQPCAYGNRCGDHAVYCHNDGWLYSPRKCTRTWYTNGERRDEDCPGFAANPSRPRPKEEPEG